MDFGNSYELQGGMRIIAKGGGRGQAGGRGVYGAQKYREDAAFKKYFRCARTQHPSSSSSGTFCPKAKRDDRRNSQRKEIKNPTKRRGFTGKGGKYRKNNEIKIAQYAIKRQEVFCGFTDFPAFFSSAYNTSMKIKCYPYKENHPDRR